MDMSSLQESLTASGGAESAGFLNDIIAQLWPNICVAAGNIAKDTVEPILASTLPSPLNNLRFVKFELGKVPAKFSKVDVHKTQKDGIKLDMNLDWQSNCDIELDGNNVPKIGIEKARLSGRLSILLCPLTNAIPLIGAAQVAFLNPPELSLDFTDAADLADFFMVKSTVRNTILGIISGMAVLPNRFLVKMDPNVDYFKTYHTHIGIVRLTIDKATGIAPPKKKSGVSRLIAKVVKDVPDCFVSVKVGAEADWRTSVQKNNNNPVWNESHDFLVTDFEQRIAVDVDDDDLAGDDDIGEGQTTIKDVLLNGGTHELSLTHQGEPTDAKLTVHAKFFNFVPEPNMLSAQNSNNPGDICGLATVLVASALGLSGQRDELNPSVKITWGDKTFQTAAKSYTPGQDIFNPSFDQAFQIPLTADMISNPASFKLSLMNKTQEAGSTEVAFQDVLGSPEMVKEDSFEVGGGASVRARIMVRGIQLAQ